MGASLYPPTKNDTGWLSFGSLPGITYSNGFSYSSGSYRLYDNRMAFSVVVKLSDTASAIPTTATGVGSGNVVGDPVIFTLPVGYRPSSVQVLLLDASLGGYSGRLQVAGTLGIYDGPTGASISPGDFITMSADYILLGM
jgi:hypothetical protein